VQDLERIGVWAAKCPIPNTAYTPNLYQIRLYQIILLILKNADQLYGTTAESVRQVIRSGRVCVLDCSPKAISSLYNSEYFYLFFK